MILDADPWLLNTEKRQGSASTYRIGRFAAVANGSVKVLLSRARLGRLRPTGVRPPITSPALSGKH